MHDEDVMRYFERERYGRNYFQSTLKLDYLEKIFKKCFILRIIDSTMGYVPIH